MGYSWSNFACLVGDDARGRMISSLPDIAVLDNCLPELKPRLLLVDAGDEERKNLAYAAVRRRMRVAVYGIQEGDEGWLRSTQACARHNKVPFQVLETWRYIPAVAAVKEMVAGGIIGPVRQIDCRARLSPFLGHLRLEDACLWLCEGQERVTPSVQDCITDADVSLEVTGELGRLLATFMLSGKNGKLEIELKGLPPRVRIVPVAEPFASELAVQFALNNFGFQLSI